MSVLCERFDGQTFTFYGNWLDLYELDPGDPDELVGELTFPDISVTVDCVQDDCIGESSWYTPSGQTGYSDEPYAEVKVYIEGYPIEINAPTPEPGTESATRGLAHVVRTSLASTSQEVPNVAGLFGLPTRAASRLAYFRRPAQSALVEFNVTDAEEGTPIEHATVMWVEEDAAGDTAVKNVRTDSAGKALSPVLQGTHEIIVFAEGYGRAFSDVTVDGPGRVEQAIRLFRAGRITGVITDAAGVPVKDAMIELVTPQRVLTQRELQSRMVGVSWFAGTRHSRRDGSFELRNLPPFDAFSIRVTHPDAGSVVAGPFSLAPGEVRSDARIILR